MPVDVMATLRKAVRQLETEKARLDRQLAALRGVLGNLNSSTDRAIGKPRRAGARKRRRRLNAAARRAVSRRMKVYWAKRKAAAAKGTPKRSRG